MMKGEITHYEVEAGNVDLYSVSQCSECGKERQEKVDTVYGRRFETKAIDRGYKKLESKPADELCDCE